MQKTLSFLASFLLLSITACPGDTGDDDGSTTTPMTGGATDTPTSGATDDPTGGAALTCDAYCTSITANCTAGNAQYFQGTDMGKASCMASCAGFPEGTAADMAGNTLGCRTYHAGAAGSDAATHCTHAGPGGEAVCGNDCDGFCSIAMEVCAGTYADMGACMTECATFATDVKYNATVMSGNNLSCRLYHLTAAAVDAATHCPHITAASAPCV